MSSSFKRSLIIPAAGSASRFRGLPKFLLPTQTNNVTLIERHLLYLRNYFDEVLIGINPDFSKNLNSILSEDEKIRIYQMSTKTMMETVIKLADESVNENFMLIMPDTFFSDYNEIEKYLKNESHNEPSLLCWDIKEFQIGKLGQVLINELNQIVEIQDKNPLCKFRLFWGIAIFAKHHLQEAFSSDPHIGFLFERLIKKNIAVKGYRIHGNYFDCGTQDEYIKMLLESKF